MRWGTLRVLFSQFGNTHFTPIRLLPTRRSRCRGIWPIFPTTSPVPAVVVRLMVIPATAIPMLVSMPGLAPWMRLRLTSTLRRMASFSAPNTAPPSPARRRFGFMTRLPTATASCGIHWTPMAARTPFPPSMACPFHLMTSISLWAATAPTETQATTARFS